MASGYHKGGRQTTNVIGEEIEAGEAEILSISRWKLIDKVLSADAANLVTLWNSPKIPLIDIAKNYEVKVRDIQFFARFYKWEPRPPREVVKKDKIEQSIEELANRLWVSIEPKVEAKITSVVKGLLGE